MMSDTVLAGMWVAIVFVAGLMVAVINNDNNRLAIAEAGQVAAMVSAGANPLDARCSLRPIDAMCSYRAGVSK